MQTLLIMVVSEILKYFYTVENKSILNEVYIDRIYVRCGRTGWNVEIFLMTTNIDWITHIH